MRRNPLMLPQTLDEASAALMTSADDAAKDGVSLLKTQENLALEPLSDIQINGHEIRTSKERQRLKRAEWMLITEVQADTCQRERLLSDTSGSPGRLFSSRDGVLPPEETPPIGVLSIEKHTSHVSAPRHNTSPAQEISLGGHLRGQAAFSAGASSETNWAGGAVSARFGSLPPDPPAPATLAASADAGWGPRKHDLVTWFDEAQEQLKLLQTKAAFGEAGLAPKARALFRTAASSTKVPKPKQLSPIRGTISSVLSVAMADSGHPYIREATNAVFGLSKEAPETWSEFKDASRSIARKPARRKRGELSLSVHPSDSNDCIWNLR